VSSPEMPCLRTNLPCSNSPIRTCYKRFGMPAALAGPRGPPRCRDPVYAKTGLKSPSSPVRRRLSPEKEMRLFFGLDRLEVFYIPTRSIPRQNRVVGASACQDPAVRRKTDGQHGNIEECVKVDRVPLRHRQPGVSLDQERAEMSTIAARLTNQYPDASSRVGMEVIPMLPRRRISWMYNRRRACNP
jgi:hypothetical protein